MREILFRGKRLDNGEWGEGFLARTTLGSTIIVNEVEEYSCGCCIGIGSANFEVDPSTVGQYTGLKDKNGKRIFEGDILSLRAGRQYVVRFENGAFVLENTAIPIRFVNKFEVIGNIHDNSELLKGGEG